MVSGIKNYSSTPGDNDSPSPNGAPEGMSPSGVNNTIRQVMAEIRKWWEKPEWIDFGHAGLTFVDTTNFRVTGDLTSVYVVNRRVRAIGTTPFEIYGRITAVNFSSPNTTVTVAWDSGTFDNTLSEIALGVDPSNKSIHANSIDELPEAPDISAAYPVGSLYFNATDSTNPATLLGFGTWEAFGAGKMIVGIDSGDTDFDTAEETGGSKTTTQTTSEMAAHKHEAGMGVNETGSGWPNGGVAYPSGYTEPGSSQTSGGGETQPYTSTEGGGGAQDNMPPYIVVHMWKRTA